MRPSHVYRSFDAPLREISPYPIHPSPLLVRLIITAETYKAALANDRETGRADRVTLKFINFISPAAVAYSCYRQSPCRCHLLLRPSVVICRCRIRLSYVAVFIICHLQLSPTVQMSNAAATAVAYYCHLKFHHICQG
jgi:hypothetical protein